jgi:1-acyl-sn-glycerol-3-phosphate acyltransferase
MKVWRIVRVGVAILLYVLILVTMIWPQGMFVRWRNRNQPLPVRRSAASVHNAIWGERLTRIIMPVIGLKVILDLPEVPPQWQSRPRIYESNHRSVMDIIIMLAVVVRLGDPDTRAVIKEVILRYPFVGSLMRGTGYAVVVREKDRPGMAEGERRKHNLQALRQAAAHCFEDGASIWIFPEGTRHNGSFVEGARRRHVGEPITAGFALLCKYLPNHPVVSVTFLWPKTGSGRTMLESDVFCDRTVRVVARFHPPVPYRAAADFLETDWDEKEDQFAALG